MTPSENNGAPQDPNRGPADPAATWGQPGALDQWLQEILGENPASGPARPASNRPPAGPATQPQTSGPAPRTAGVPPSGGPAGTGQARTPRLANAGGRPAATPNSLGQTGSPAAGTGSPGRTGIWVAAGIGAGVTVVAAVLFGMTWRRVAPPPVLPPAPPPTTAWAPGTGTAPAAPDVPSPTPPAPVQSQSPPAPVPERKLGKRPVRPAPLPARVDPAQRQRELDASGERLWADLMSRTWLDSSAARQQLNTQMDEVVGEAEKLGKRHTARRLRKLRRMSNRELAEAVIRYDRRY